MTEETLFQEVLSRSPEERAGFLDQACAGRPALRAAIEALLAAHEKVGHLRDDQGLTVDPASVEATPNPDDQAPPLGTTTFHRPTSSTGIVIAGRYALTEKIGEGGMGEVWVAKQSEPVKRKVALKLIKTGMDSKAVLARFEQERQALAMMDHPNIARVFDGGMTPTGQPFFVMELVNGSPLTKFCDEARLTPKARLELFLPICQAVQHAHQKGIVHRDLKPANILVTSIDGRPVPKVIDFGVAKALTGKLTDESLSTQLGAVVGTLEYMSPEQAGVSGEDIDTRADIYSLGVILYELLTGLRPIDGTRLRKATFMEMIRIIREDEPAKPSTRLSTDESLPSLAALRQTEPKRLLASLRGELDWVVMKCLEKQRHRRYETVNGLARDIERYLIDEPVEARPPSAGYRLRKFLRRNRGPVLAASLVVLALLGGIAGTIWGLIRAENRRAEAEQARDAESKRVEERDAALIREAKRIEERDAALEKRDAAIGKADRALDEARYQLDTSHFLLALGAYDNGDVPLARQRLDAIDAKHRGWEWHYLRRQATGGIFTLEGHAGRVLSVAYSPDGTRIFTGSDDTTAKVWDARTGKFLLDLKGPRRHEVNSVAFSPDGTRIATGGSDKTAKVWDARTGKSVLELKGLTGQVSSVAFSPDGTRIITGSGDFGKPGEAKVWDARTGNLLIELKGHTRPVLCVAYSPDGTRIATGGGDTSESGEAKIWNARTGMLLLDLTRQTKLTSVCGVAFSPDSERIVTGCENGTAKVWDARTGTPQLGLPAHSSWVESVAFSPDGMRIVTCGDNIARVWDARTGLRRAELKGHAGWLTSVAFSPDGEQVVTGSSDETAKVWDARTGTPKIELKSRKGEVTSVAISPDGTRIVTGTWDGIVQIWDAWTGTPRLELKGLSGSVLCVAFSPDGTRIATSGGVTSHLGEAKVWDARTGMLLLDLKGHTDTVSSVAFSPDGTSIATGSRDKTAKVWDARTGAPLLGVEGAQRGLSII